MAYNKTQENARRRRQMAGIPAGPPRVPGVMLTAEPTYDPPESFASVIGVGGTFHRCLLCPARRRSPRAARRHVIRSHAR